MGLLSGLFRSRDKPYNRAAGSGYSFFMGGTSTGKNVNERSAMQMTAVYACVRILSEAVAELPLYIYKYGANGGKEKAVDHPLYLLLHDEPNPEMSSFVFREIFIRITKLFRYLSLFSILHHLSLYKIVGLGNFVKCGNDNRMDWPSPQCRSSPITGTISFGGPLYNELPYFFGLNTVQENNCCDIINPNAK